MDKDEARRILKEELSKYKKRSYADLLKIADEPETYELTTESGKWYQIEIIVLFQDKDPPPFPQRPRGGMNTSGKQS